MEMQTKTPVLGNYIYPDLPDASKWADCVHCGMCLETCPTYNVTQQEQNSPRGRVHLMKSIAEGKTTLIEQMAKPIQACIDCRACTTACPADVQVGALIEEVRGQLRQAMPLKGWKKMVNNLILHQLFPHQNRLNRLGGFLKFYQKSGLQTVTRKTGLIKIMPDHLVDLESVMPEIKKPVRKRYKDMKVIPAKGEMKNEVAFMTGCVMDVMFTEANQATINVLTRNGNNVTIPEKQVCCGALHFHTGEREKGKELAKQNIIAFEEAGTIVINSAGCGCMLKEYEEIFHDDPEWADRAKAFSRKVQDISKYLVDTGYVAPKSKVNVKLTYHDACHLAHGQGIRKEPRELIQSIPGVELIEMENSDRCCGSGGVYNVLQPDLAGAVLKQKMEFVPDDVELVVMGNPGCMLQMSMGVKKYGNGQRVIHIMELMDQAYQKEEVE